MNQYIPNQNLTMAGSTKQMQIIIGAMAMGALTFGVISLVIGDWDPTNFDLITMLACGWSGMCIAASLVVPRVIAANGVRQLAASGGEMTVDRLASVRQTATIIGAALCEGGAFFCCVAYMTEGHYAALIAEMFCLAALILRFPTVSGNEDWAQEQIRAHRN